MSGRGLVSVRLPQSMLDRLWATTRQQGLTVNQYARNVVAGLAGLNGPQIRQIPEPASESRNPRLSVYLGDAGVQTLSSAALASGISPSSVLRRALSSAMTANLQFSADGSVTEGEQRFSWLWLLLAVAVPIVGGILNAFLDALATARQKDLQSEKQGSVSEISTRRSGDEQQ